MWIFVELYILADVTVNGPKYSNLMFGLEIRRRRLSFLLQMILLIFINVGTGEKMPPSVPLKINPPWWLYWQAMDIPDRIQEVK